jgi:hypothetical protein
VTPAQPEADVTPTIAAIMSVPRLGWQDHYGSAHKALSDLGISAAFYTGAFWQKCMQQGFEDHLAAEWLLCLDYDSLFNVTQLKRLLRTFLKNPHFDALAALQPRRGDGVPMMWVNDENGNRVTEVSGTEPTKASAAHFGMTVIRTAALKAIPKPWFMSTPSAAGEWDKNAVDADIYFWKKWEEHGKTLYVDPNVRVGHLELMVSLFDEFMIQRHVPIAKWRDMYLEDGKHGLEKKETRG